MALKVKVSEPLAVTKKNFDKAVVKILGKPFAEAVKNPTTQLEKAIAVAFIEQLEKKEDTKKQTKLLRTVALRLRKNGQFVWDKESK